MAAEMVSELPTPVHIIHHERFLQGSGWLFHDISLCSSGKIAISGGHYEADKSLVCVYSTDNNFDCGDKSKLLYSKDFKDKYNLWRRCVSFIKPTSTEILTCVGFEIQVLDYKQDVVLRSCKVDDTTRCLSVDGDRIFVAFTSSTVRIYDYHLMEITRTTLTGMQMWPLDIVAAADRLYVCTSLGSERAIVYSLNSGLILKEYTNRQDPHKAESIAVNLKFEVIAVLLYQDTTNQKRVTFYLPSDDQPFLAVPLEKSVSRIRISDRGRIVTGSFTKGEVKCYGLASIFTYSRFKNFFVSRLERDDCEMIMGFFLTESKEMKTIVESNMPSETLLRILEEKNVIQPSKVDELGEALLRLKMNPFFYHVTRIYQAFMDAMKNTTEIQQHTLSTPPRTTEGLESYPFRRIEEGVRSDFTNEAAVPDKMDYHFSASNENRMETGRYKKQFNEIIKINSGAFGTVTKVEHKTDKQTYAVKRVSVSQSNINKMLREVTLLAKITNTPSSRVVRYHTSWFENQGSPEALVLYIQMELCTNSLREWLTDRNENDKCEVNNKDNVKILSQILEGMKSIHQLEILHRDLKPENIFFSRTSDVRIGDLGLAREIKGSELSADIGTLLYMAPEIREGKNYDTKVDMYSFGIIMYEMFQLFKTPEMKLDGIRKLTKERFLSREFQGRWPKEAKFILRLISKDPTERPDASEALRCIEEIKPLQEPEEASSEENSNSDLK